MGGCSFQCHGHCDCYRVRQRQRRLFIKWRQCDWHSVLLRNACCCHCLPHRLLLVKDRSSADGSHKLHKGGIPRHIPSPASSPQSRPLPPAGEVLDPPLSFQLKNRSIIFCGREYAMHSTLVKASRKPDFRQRTHTQVQVAWILTTLSQHPRRGPNPTWPERTHKGCSSRVKSLADVERRHSYGLSGFAPGPQSRHKGIFSDFKKSAF